MRPNREKLSKMIGTRVSETEHSKLQALPWSSRKIIRNKIREVLSNELAKV